ncbi:MAG TPA: hypothetical protein VGH54_21340 [Mycobacterium sp.]|jgi:hypothetical protein|uniref:hypothetical protein n=1 Tax=Mycobacterium sp. TaxID=1785 RepID=UPI002F41205E
MSGDARIETAEALDDLLSSMNDAGIEPVVVGVDGRGYPFLAYGWAPGGDGWDCGVVADDTHSSEFDYSDGTTRCDECGAFDRRPLTVLPFPVTVFTASTRRPGRPDVLLELANADAP